MSPWIASASFGSAAEAGRASEASSRTIGRENERMSGLSLVRIRGGANLAQITEAAAPMPEARARGKTNREPGAPAEFGRRAVWGRSQKRTRMTRTASRIFTDQKEEIGRVGL